MAFKSRQHRKNQQYRITRLYTNRQMRSEDHEPADGKSASDSGESERLLARLEHVLDETDTVVWEADIEELAIEYVGPAERIGGLDPESIASPMEFNTRVVHPDDQVVVAERFESLLDGTEEAVDVEFRTSPENGPVRWVRMQGSVETWADGEPTTLAGLATDITPLKEREARLEKFAGVVSHDLRNPLSVASARIELAQEEQNSEHLARARDALDRMEVLIENLLTLARADRAVGSLEPVALGSVVNGAWKAVDTAGAGLTVETDRTVRADRTRLRQLFENLVRNAVEHGSPDNGTAADEHADEVTVRIGALEGGFFVEDDGVGMPAEHREGLFSGGTGDEYTGLGLRIVEEVVEAHDWTVRATESDAGGVRFEITGVEFV
jgi:PAS domain S-box-containing protein